MSSSALPSSDRVVHALWRAGDAQAAASFALAALARHDRYQARLRSQLERLRAGQPLDEPTAPPPALGEELMAELVDRNRYDEARVVLDATSLGGTPVGRRLTMLFDAALAPFPEQADPSFSAVLHLIRAGQATSALRALEEVARQMPQPPDWITRRQRALGALVSGTWRQGPAPVERVTRDHVITKLRRRDLVGALEAARAAEARELAAVLARLVEGTAGVFSESTPDSDDPATSPMEGHPLCEFQIRMGVLEQAEKGYRVLLRKLPEDDRARAMLADVINLRQALGDSPDPMPSRRASVAWLSKNAPRQSKASGWASGGSADGSRHQRFEDEEGEDATGVLEPSQEAELLLKLGKAQQALDMYRILAIRHPDQQSYRRRIGEIEALIAQRGVPTSAEVTLKHVLGDRAHKGPPPIPDVPPERSAQHPRISEEEIEFPTVIETRPKHLFGEDTEKD